MSVLAAKSASRPGRGGLRPTEKGGSSRVAEVKVTSSPRSVRRLLGIFDAIASAPEGLSLADLSGRLKSPKSSLLTLLRPLSADGYLVHSNGRYALGREIFALANNILSARKLSALMRTLMEEAQQNCGETIILATMDAESESVTYVEVIESNQLIRYSVPAGVTRPLYTSAAGQLLLAYQAEKWREHYLKTTKLKPLTERTITDGKVLRQKLETIRNEGVSLSVSEAVDGATGVAAPIFDGDGQVVAALLIAGPSDRQSRNREKWRKLAKEYAAKASRALGFVASVPA
jgi:IclR family transcriptional regulator, acetate operon repressor